jgi:hypothetical protein
MFSFCSSKGRGEVQEQELKWFVPTVRHVKDELNVGQVLEPKHFKEEIEGLYHYHHYYILSCSASKASWHSCILGLRYLLS